MASRDDSTLLSVEDLSVSFRSDRQWVQVLRSVSFDVRRGEILGLVGESGSGKTITSMAIMGLVRTLGGRINSGKVMFQGRELLALPEREWLAVRGGQIAMIFQQPTRSLNPAFTVGDQIAEAVRLHQDVSRREAWTRAVEMLDRVHIADAARRARDYPHTFSGGMSQRVMIAMALACGPSLLIADEPTTALDVTVQARILALLRELRAEMGLSMIYITHDLGVVAQICDRVAVMYAGEVAEAAPVNDVFFHPRHPYTEGLLNSIPRRGQGKRMIAIPGQVPPPHDMPDGCRFHPRCRYCEPETCTDRDIELVPAGDEHATRCARTAVLELKGIR